MGLPVITSAKYESHREWARSLLHSQGLDETSVDKILENYTCPIELPCLEENNDADKNVYSNSTTEEEGVECQAGGEGIEAASVTQDTDVAVDDTACPCDEDESCNLVTKKVQMEGNEQYDPLAQYGHYVGNDPLDSELLCKVHCYRHDDLIIHCGCSTERLLLQQTSSTAGVKNVEVSINHGYVLVQEEEEHICEEDGDSKGELIKTEKLVCRRNPYRIIEYLQLGLEEAFFLVYALGCLTVYYMEEPLSIAKLWDVFSVIKPSFRTTYMAYHYFRSKGWVPKVGLKYGTDLLLYRKGPPFYHASYSVVVQMVDGSDMGRPQRSFTWRSLAGLNRTTVNASKELMFCYLIRPSDMTNEEMSSPSCMKRIKVQELIFSRWVSSRERTDQE